MPQRSAEGTKQFHSGSLLVIAHPGHELRVHRWLEMATPEVWVLTDGSGHTGRSRIDSTTRLLTGAGAVAGPVYGKMSDADLYNAVLTCNHRPFIDLADQLAARVLERPINLVAGDAEEGYNPGHDVCRLVINTAIRLVERRIKKQMANYDFALVGPPGRCPEELRADSIWLDLDDAAFSRKVSAARSYPELAREVETALDGKGDEAFQRHSDLLQQVRSNVGVSHADNFRVECLRPVKSHAISNTSLNGQPPFYEEYGERQVKAGFYKHVLRYSEHMLPLVEALGAHVERSS